MSLEQIIINLETIATVIKEISTLADYTKAVELGHPNLKTNLADVEHYLEDTLIRLEELRDIQFVESLDIDLSKCIPYTEDMQTLNKYLLEAVPMSEDLYTKATELTKGMVADFNEELEGDFW